jgi:hypothetical protein
VRSAYFSDSSCSLVRYGIGHNFGQDKFFPPFQAEGEKNDSPHIRNVNFSRFRLPTSTSIRALPIILSPFFSARATYPAAEARG